MPSVPDTLIARLQAACTAAEQAEQTVQAEVEARLEQVRRTRAFAWRRYHVLKDMAEAAAREPEREAAVERQLVGLFRDVGWIATSLDELGAAGLPLIERLRPIAEALHTAHHPAAGDEAVPAVAVPAVDPLADFRAFEDWYQQERGQPFLQVFERYLPPTPVVEF